MTKRPAILLVLAAVGLIAAHSGADAQYVCENVASRGELDPSLSFFGNRFRSETAINSNGDMLFVARPLGEKDRLYLYPNGGAASVVAEGGGPAPVLGATFTARPFDDPSLNDATDLAFWGRLLAQGEGVFVRPGGGALTAAAYTTQPSPVGGVFDEFPEVAETNSTGSVAFLATSTGGPTAVFTYDIPGGGPPVAAVAVGAATTGGREVCDILDVDHADGGDLALLATTKVSCANVAETAIDTVLHVSGATITEIAKEGDASPIGGTTYGAFKLTPQVNAAGEVAFETKLAGVLSAQAVFLWNGVSVTPVVVQGDFSPVAGGTYRKFSDIALANGTKVFVKARFKGGTTKEAVVRLDPPASETAVVRRDDAPPAPPYGVGAFYRKLGKFISVSHDGTDVGLVPKIKDVAVPRNKVGVIRCASPSGAFVDGAVLF